MVRINDFSKTPITLHENVRTGERSHIVAFYLHGSRICRVSFVIHEYPMCLFCLLIHLLVLHFLFIEFFNNLFFHSMRPMQY